MIKKNKIPDIRAEVLLNYLYPEMAKEWIARGEGVFYRNYNSDLLEIDDESKEIMMSRDGFLKLLPQGVLTEQTSIKGDTPIEQYKRTQRRMRLLKEAFLPIDTVHFQQSLLIEAQISELLQIKLSYVLQTYFGVDIENEPSRLVKEAAILLPYVNKLRGNFDVVASILGSLMHCEVQQIVGRYSETDTTRRWLPSIKFELLIPDLTPEGYKELDNELEPLRTFIKEWFIPVEIHCSIVIKEHQEMRKPTTKLVLDYNTELKK